MESAPTRTPSRGTVENRSGTIGFAIAVHGTRGDIEPAAAVACELQRRGHDVRMAVPPNLVGLAASAGLCSMGSCGPDSRRQLEAEVFRRKPLDSGRNT
ncbi:glycosyltransferase [Bradyrhizobium betae]|uniref:glycosyltransferase n=1 Tax=Bradyrhizobium TaxID=374 RepID=UPI00359CB079